MVYRVKETKNSKGQTRYKVVMEFFLFQLPCMSTIKTEDGIFGRHIYTPLFISPEKAEGYADTLRERYTNPWTRNWMKNAYLMQHESRN
jgi:hypothetical protein